MPSVATRLHYSAPYSPEQKMKNGNDNIAEWLKQKYASFGVRPIGTISCGRMEEIL